MLKVLGCFTGSHDHRLVGLAVLVCILASSGSIQLLRHAQRSSERFRFTWLAIAAAAGGSGIWATHFIAMLAFEPGIPTGYDVSLTIVSILYSIIITGAGMTCALLSKARIATWTGGVIVGIGIAAMHFTGMAAFQVAGQVIWDSGIVAASIVLGVAFSSMAVAHATGEGGLKRQLWASTLLFLAICGHHFVAMGAVTIVPDSSFELSSTTMSGSGLAAIVALISSLLLLCAGGALVWDLRVRHKNPVHAERIQAPDAVLLEEAPSAREINLGSETGNYVRAFDTKAKGAGIAAGRKHASRSWQTLSLMLMFLVGLWSLFAISAASSRRQAYDDAATSLTNVATALAADVAHSLEQLDRSLQAAASSWSNDEIRALRPSLRHQVVFDTFVSTEAFGPQVIVDSYGSVLARSNGKEIDQYGEINVSSAAPEPVYSYADRQDFKVHANGDHLGLYIGSVPITEPTGQMGIPLSRRLSTPSGDFAGIVSGTLRLSYILDAYKRLRVRSGGVLTLANSNGVLLAREPSLAGRAVASVRQNLARIGALQNGGLFEAKSVVDGVEKLYAFRRIAGFPLIQFAGMPVAQIYGDWLQRTCVMGGLLVFLTAGILLLQLMLARELGFRRVAEATLERLASQDALTGLFNRRVFDAALEREWQLAARRGSVIGLLMIDVDHFKAYNDMYGHPGGDEVLKAVAKVIAMVAGDCNGLACRYGGEEFAILLPAIVGTGSLYAQDLTRRVCQCALPHSGSALGIVTVSIGVSAMAPGTDKQSKLLVSAADEQLYEAKRLGRNRFSVRKSSLSNQAA